MIINKIMVKNKEADVETSVLGISGENEQEKLIFSFEDGFIDGTCFLDLEFPSGNKKSIELQKEDETYILEVKSSLLTEIGDIIMQLKIVCGSSIWKSIIFKMNVLNAINASETIDVQYPCFTDWIKRRVQELEIGFKQIEKMVDGCLNEEIDPTVPAYVKSIMEEDIESWNNKSDFSGDYEDLENKPELIDTSNFVTKAVDDLVNYYKIADTYSKGEINSFLSNFSKASMEVVESLPTENISSSIIYLLAKENAEENNIYDEYIYVSDKWEMIGDTKVDLTGYVRQDELDGLASKLYVDEMIGDIDVLLDSIADESEAI